MLELGIIHQANPGCFHYLPLGVRALNKLVNIIDTEMQSIGGQKLIFPTLVKSDLWTQSGIFVKHFLVQCHTNVFYR